MEVYKDLTLTQPLDSLYNNAVEVIDSARERAYKQINESLVRRNWELGKLIAEEEIRGRERSEIYGLDVIKSLSKRLTEKYGKGFSKTNLYSYVNFYKMFPEIFHLTSGKSRSLLTWTHYSHQNICSICQLLNN
ncbi:MAG: hypothetical protein J1E38_00195 [Paramuribaculum sp.]|nr:hypothetical protein [Paramuribaculum sp.]